MMRRSFFEEKLVLLWLMIISFLTTLAQDNQGRDILFDGSVNYGIRDSNGVPILTGQSSSNSMSPEQMEIEAAQAFNEITSIEDFLRVVQGIPEGENIGSPPVFSRFGEERSNVEIPKRAGCIPEPQIVCLRNSSMTLYYPDCTRVPRCGGCCQNNKLSCQPTATVTRNFQVYVSERVNHQFKYRGKEVIPVEEHTKCTCGCTEKAEHCNEKQIYKAQECRCACMNTDEEIKCIRNNRTKQWDSKTCSCKCRGSTMCTSGSYYDHNTCSCKLVTTARRQKYPTDTKGTSNSPNYRFDWADNSDFGTVGRSPVIYTINSDDPRRRHKEDPE